MLPLPGGIHPLFHFAGGFGLRSGTQILKMHRRHFHHNVDSVKQGPRNPAPVVLHRLLGAGAPAGGVAVPAALAGVHGTHQHEFRRISHGPGDPGNGDLSILQGLAHHVQGILAKLRQLIQKQHALVGHGNLTGLGVCAAAGKAGIGYSMVGAAEGTPGHQRFFCGQHTHNGINLADLQRLLPAHFRQDRRKPLAEHAFTGAGRANQQHIVAAGSRHLHGPLYILLAQHILKIKFGTLRLRGDPGLCFC